MLAFVVLVLIYQVLFLINFLVEDDGHFLRKKGQPHNNLDNSVPCQRTQQQSTQTAKNPRQQNLPAKKNIQFSDNYCCSQG
jgi:hypothetical protein